MSISSIVTVPTVLPATPTLPGGLPSIPGGLPTPPTPASFDTVSVRSPRLANDWGVYYNSVKVISPDSILSLEYKREWRLSDYPQELGAFQSYNKVAVPFDVRLRMMLGGDAAARQSFLNEVEQAAASLNLYSVVTPDRVYTSVNIVAIGYSRSASQGLGLISVDVGLRQVRVTATTTFVQTKAAAGQTPSNGGTVAPSVPTALQGAALTQALQRKAISSGNSVLSQFNGT